MNEMNYPFFEVGELDSTKQPWWVAMVSETYPPEVNGVARTLQQVVQGLLDRGHELQLVRPRQGKDERPASSPNFNEVLTKGLTIPMYRHLRMGLPSKRTLMKLWQDKRPALVHIATEGPLGWSALRAATELRLPVVSDFRTNFQAYAQYYGISWLQGSTMAYLRSFHNQCNQTMVPTEALLQQLSG